MAENYDPPESKIQEVIARTGGDPRKLAIAYLRAQRRARSAELEARLTGDLQDATLSALTGKGDDAIAALKKMHGRLEGAKDMKTTETLSADLQGKSPAGQRAPSDEGPLG